MTITRELTVKRLCDMTPQERRICASMSYKSGGDMLRWMNEAQTNPYRHRDMVVLVREEDLIVGWAIRRFNGDAGFWTRATHRQQGIGSEMVNAIKGVGRIKTYPHNLASAKLFKKNRALSREDARKWNELIRQTPVKSRRGL